MKPFLVSGVAGAGEVNLFPMVTYPNNIFLEPRYSIQ